MTRRDRPRPPIAFPTHTRCAACGEPLTTMSTTVTIPDRYDPETNEHPIVHDSTECIATARASSRFPRSELPAPLHGDDLARWFDRHPIHGDHCPCRECVARTDSPMDRALREADREEMDAGTPRWYPVAHRDPAGGTETARRAEGADTPADAPETREDAPRAPTGPLAEAWKRARARQLRDRAHRDRDAADRDAQHQRRLRREMWDLGERPSCWDPEPRRGKGRR